MAQITFVWEKTPFQLMKALLNTKEIEGVIAAVSPQQYVIVRQEKDLWQLLNMIVEEVVYKQKQLTLIPFTDAEQIEELLRKHYKDSKEKDKTVENTAGIAKEKQEIKQQTEVNEKNNELEKIIEETTEEIPEKTDEEKILEEIAEDLLEEMDEGFLEEINEEIVPSENTDEDETDIIKKLIKENEQSKEASNKDVLDIDGDKLGIIGFFDDDDDIDLFFDK